ncbi:Crp/Fnr family transcriptional regulator [Sphingomonas bacterium]|uniref:Crp/Fnr family transcriptional regulator n=1 Tax=Sphingomonas bacterium TaxID=1895847 RepID=UPI0026274664|nr:Crp/Fnr family transcriptional regulator [Sphingomonas bacterium]
MRRAALVTRMEQHLALTDDEREALDDLQRHELRFTPGQLLMEQDRPNDMLYVVQQGWVHSARRLVNGGRQIVGFHYAGDLVGTSSIAWSLATNTVTAVSDCIVSELPKASLGRLFRAQPRIAGALYAISAADYVAMGDRLTSIGRMGAIERLSLLLLDIIARLRVTAGGVIDSFDLPLTQQDIGDAVGLTKVHVSRTLGDMERRELIERRGRRVRLKAEAELIEMTGFVDRHGVIETDWISAPEA